MVQLNIIHTPIIQWRSIDKFNRVCKNTSILVERLMSFQDASDSKRAARDLQADRKEKLQAFFRLSFEPATRASKLEE